MNENCPLKQDFHEAAYLGKELAKTMRKIRRKLNICDACEFLDDCGIRNEFNQKVDGIISELVEEWGLIGERSSEARAINDRK